MTDPDCYRVPAKRGEATQLVQRSRFLAVAALATTPEAAWSLVDERRKQLHDAAHHAYAFRVGEVDRFSDDGEPAGTAGRPIFGAITAANVESVAVVVTRYFGGVKLGPGGLARAYADAAREALVEAGAQERFRSRRIAISFDFDVTSPVHHAIQKFEAQTVTSNYSERAHLTLELRASRLPLFLETLRESTAGRVEIDDGC